MKILYHHRTASRDGQWVHIQELIGALQRLGHEVVVVAPTPAATGKLGDKPGFVGWLRAHAPRFVNELLELAYNVVMYLRLRRAYLEFRPDVFYERHNLYVLAGAWLRRRFGVPYLLEVNSPYYIERSAHGGLALGWVARATEHWVWRQADCLLPVSHVLAQILCDGGAAADRILVVPNGIDPEHFAVRMSTDEAKRKLGIDKHLVLGFTGFVREWNALGEVVEYIARPQNAHCFLLIVGDGPARADIEAQARSLGVADRVRLTGVMPRDQINDLVSAFDVALQPAANPYASPLKLFEYLALGRAIVAPDQPNVREILTDGEDAVLFDPARAGAMSDGLDRLTRDAALRTRLGTAAQGLIGRRRYTWAENGNRVAEAAQGLLRRRTDLARSSLPSST